MRCKKHRRYKAKLRPRCGCLICWIMYIENNFNITNIEKGIEYIREKDIYNDDNMGILNYLMKKKNELKMEI